MQLPPTTKNSHKKTVFAWGAFDLLHAGHIEYLKKARALGDSLVVAVYSDTIVSRLYDKTRPFVPHKERMEVLTSFEMVDRVILIRNISPINKIKQVAPHIIASCDIEKDSNLENAVSDMNLEFVRIKLRARKSTTGIIQKIKKSFSNK
jgi:D-beta-D-heptose 7-phosphate kinase/D-beta-D-heptose 1-phosphate adenosyltransferase